jgi:hypothetical protein
MRISWSGVLVLAAAVVGCRSAPSPEPVEAGPPASWSPLARAEVETALREALEAAEGLHDYRCHFHRLDRVGGVLGTPQEMVVKFRREPFSLYMRWIDPAKENAEVLYMVGANDGKLVAHLGGPLWWMMPTLHLAPDDPMVTSRSRHPVVNFGMAPPIRKLLADIARGDRTDTGVRVRRLGPGTAYGEAVVGWEIDLPDEPTFYAPSVKVWLSPVSHLLVRLQAFEADGALLEDYAFTQLKPNVGLTDWDFNPANPEYHF